MLNSEIAAGTDKPKARYVVPSNKLNENAEYFRAYKHLEVPNHVTIEDLLRPSTWAHHARTLRVDGIIDVMSEDKELDVQLRVHEIDVGMVVMRVRFVARDRDEAEQTEPVDEGPEPEVPAGYRVGFVPAHGHFARLVVTGDYVAEHCESKRAAIEAAIEHCERAEN